ncbi:hypothetical protein [Verminephrobacter aporrectodeae]|uniref:hypothetical protein n=1 Tax=Verminephrobacter aporrectodeae TaxID=1110389 RepID=UPI001F176B1C|nr:hypothetical protein [Verminephrobacter aporrectodeae]
MTQFDVERARGQRGRGERDHGNAGAQLKFGNGHGFSLGWWEGGRWPCLARLYRR